MKGTTLPWSGRRLATKGAAVALATATAASVAGMAAAPARSATATDCPDTFPVTALIKNQPVTGLTVTDGTAPEAFTGTVIGVLKDGIMPGLDMIMVDLGAADGTGADDTIHDVGVWSGMSGSPVYAADGRLIGAVAYGLAGNSTVAGLTPAAEMRQLIDGGATQSAPAKTVKVPERLADRAVRSGAATRAEAGTGLRQLNVMALSGLSEQRFNKATRKLDLGGVERMVGTAGYGDDLDAGDIVSGGNIAAAISYGDISYTGVGTATMVCGTEVAAFGHPMMWSGPTGLSLHPAAAVYIQKDALWAGFKVANVGDPVGTIDQDRMAGIAGAFGTDPATAEITADVTSQTGQRLDSKSWVNLSDEVPFIALFHLLTNEDRVFDGMGKGSGTVSYVVTGEAEDGTPFAIERKDVYADERDLTWSTAWDLYMDLSRLTGNRVANVSLETVDIDSTLTREYRKASIEQVSIKLGGEWRPLDAMRRLVVPPRSTVRLKVDLRHTVTGPSSIKVDVPILKKDAGRRGYLEVVGGNSTDSWWSGRKLPLDKLIARIEGASHNDELLVGTRFFRTEKRERNVHREERTSLGVPVNGYEGIQLRVIGEPKRR